MNLRHVILCLVPLLPVLAAEVFSDKWMNPKITAAYIYPTLPQLVADPTFKSTPEEFDAIRGKIVCSDGWLGRLGSDTSGGIQLAWIEWNGTEARNTLEAFRHKPEVCMGANGMTVEKSYPRRVYGSGDKQFVFDSNLFRPLRGGPGIYIFKAVWVSGLVGANYREEILPGASIDELRNLRFAVIGHRFKPERTRVLMAGVSGLPSEELAWKSFSRKILPQIQWTTVAP
jgi:hypothetical protein